MPSQVPLLDYSVANFCPVIAHAGQGIYSTGEERLFAYLQPIKLHSHLIIGAGCLNRLSGVENGCRVGRVDPCGSEDLNALITGVIGTVSAERRGTV